MTKDKIRHHDLDVAVLVPSVTLEEAKEAAKKMTKPEWGAFVTTLEDIKRDMEYLEKLREEAREMIRIANARKDT